MKTPKLLPWFSLDVKMRIRPVPELSATTADEALKPIQLHGVAPNKHDVGASPYTVQSAGESLKLEYETSSSNMGTVDASHSEN